MEKNKNRTDLLAAGRKKLQQYRQKKDGKGSKSTGKGSRHDRDVVIDEASSTAKPAKGKNQLPVAEGPVQGLIKEPVDSPVAANPDGGTRALSSPNVATEVSRVGEDASSLTLVNNNLDDLVPAKGLQKSNSYDGMTTISSSDTVNVEDKPESGYVPVMPVGLKAVLDYANASETDELKSAHGEDQEDNNSAMEPDNRSSLMDLDGGVNSISSVDERVQDDSGDVQEATKMVNEQTFSFVDERVQEDPDATKEDVHSASPHSVPISDGFPALTPEPSSQLKEDVLTVVHGDEDIKLPPTITGAHLKNDAGFSLLKSGSSEFHERLIEHLYITNFEKEVIYLQLCEQSNVQEFDHHHLQGVSDNSAVANSFDDVQGKNKYLSDELAQCKSELDIVKCEREELQKHLSSSKIELSRFPALIDELQIELDRSKHQLSNVSSDLVDCRGLLADLQVKNEDLSAHVASLMEEKNKLQMEKVDGALEKENLSKELMECNALLEQSRVDNVNARGSLALLTEERIKLEEEKKFYVGENDRLLAELGELKRSVEAFQLENADLNETLTSERENRSKLETENEHLVQEKDKLYTELLECQNLVETLRSENANLNGNLDFVTMERSRLGDEIGRLKIEMEEHAANCRTLMKDMQGEYEKGLYDVKNSTPSLEQLTTLKDDQLKWDVFEDSLGFVALKRRLFEVEKVMHKLEKAIEEMHSHSGGKAVAPGVSKLIQAFESKGHGDDELEETPLREVSDVYMSAKEQITNMKDLFKDLVLDVENASELFKGERSGKTLSDTRVKELMLHLEALKEQNYNLEENFIKQVVLDEVVKQYVCTVEAKKDEFVVLYEDLKLEEIVTKAKNYELTGKLCNFESRISELQVQVDELQQQSQNVASLNHQLEILHRKLDASTGTVPTLLNGTSDSWDVGSRVATSVDAAVSLIQDLQTNLEDAQRNYNLLSRSHEDMAEKTKDLEEKSELAADVLHKIYDNLQKLVNDSHPSTVESQNLEKLLPLQISNYDALILQLEKLIFERGQLESMNREHISELLERKKDIEELNRKCLNADLIAKLLEYIETAVKLEDIEIKVDEPVSSIEYMIHFLTERCRIAEEQVGMFKEKAKSKEMRLVELQDETDHLSLSIIAYENESHILKESLRSAMEQLITIQSEMQLKETELQQAEQRVSGLREKLHIAVTKGKGLISQRDSLKQSLAATSSELEKCLHELQSKDATLRETETKLKTYSEAGERMEALESELSYIRNSATALRESFLLKDSALQRIEEILEDLELPEHFHARDIIEKVDWLARSVSGNSFPDSTWDQKSSTEPGSYPGSGFGPMDGWKEDPQPASVPGDELRRNYEELESKFYGLAEQNEMLEQSLMERNILVQQWEEILDKITVPPQLRSLEPEHKIEWLQSSLSEANSHCESLQHNVYNLENMCGSLTADLEDSKRRLVDLESALSLITNEREHLFASLENVRHDYDKVSEKAALYGTENAKLQNEIGALTADFGDSKRRLVDLESALSSITNEREHLSSSLEVASHDYDKVSEKVALYETENAKLQNEIGALQSKLEEKSVDEENIHHLHSEIRRLQDLINDVLQDPETEDLNSSTSDVQRLEGLLRKLVDKYTVHPLSQHAVQQEAVEHDPSVLEKKLEEVEGDLMRVKEERDRDEEKNIHLVQEVEALEVKNQELQKLLVQEEQKSASVKEKLNVAVRKGKSLVQQRDSMKQSINDLTSEVERLNSDIKLRENTLSEFEQKIKDLLTFKERTKEFDSEINFLKSRLAKADSELSMILGAVADIDLGVELRINDPIEKLQQIDKIWHKLHASMSSYELDLNKSKRANELLVAELNEVQERNEDLQEELSKATMEISELSKENDLAEAARRESLSRLEQLSALHSEERSSEFSELMGLKSDLDQLKMVFIDINNLLNDVLPRDLDILYNLESNMKSLLESSDTSNMGSQTLKGAPSVAISRSENKVNFLHSDSFLDHKIEEQFGENKISNLLKSVGRHVQDLIPNISAFEEKLRNHSKSLHEEVVVLSETVNTLQKKISSHENSLESAKEEIAQKEEENLMRHRFISMLYEACKSSVLEIEKCKSQLVENISSAEASISIEGGDISEERITNMVNRLLSHVKDFHSIRAESVEVSQKEMKATISSLQKELREKDIEKDKICVELVSQIKQAEAAAKNKLQELEAAKSNIHDLQGQLEAVNEKCNVLEHRVKDLEGQEAVLADLQEKVKSVTDELRAKEQEAEALLHALDEEEAQMEDLTNKITDLERVVQQKDLDMETIEASRGKALKKLSVTVSKFDELHHLSATLLSEVEKLQSQVQERDSEISFLRDEITRCTSDSLLASKSDEEIRDILTWLDSMISGVQKHDVYLEENKINQIHEHKETLQKKITSIISELEDLREAAQTKDDLLSTERTRVEELKRKGEFLENSLREKESQLSMHQIVGDSSQPTSTSSEIVEVEPVQVNKWTKKGTAVAPQVRSLRKINNDQLAISINDVDSDHRDKLEDEDDDKAHGFKSLTTSKIVPRFTRPVSNLIDGLWVSCDRALMRQPALRLALIIYWAVMHALLAIFVV